MIKAVVFDWDGVLIDDPKGRLHAYCAEKIGVDKTILYEEMTPLFDTQL